MTRKQKCPGGEPPGHFIGVPALSRGLLQSMTDLEPLLVCLMIGQCERVGSFIAEVDQSSRYRSAYW